MLQDIKTRIIATFDTALHLAQAEDGHLRPSPEKWSSQEHLGHLFLSGRGIISSLAKDKSFFERFGAPMHPGRDPQLLETETFIQAQGAVSPAAFDPNAQPEILDAAALFEAWATLKEKLSERLNEATWSEADLDTYCLVHPRFGQLTMREMLIFMAFHHEHHIRLAQVKTIA